MNDVENILAEEFRNFQVAGEPDFKTCIAKLQNSAEIRPSFWPRILQCRVGLVQVACVSLPGGKTAVPPCNRLAANSLLCLVCDFVGMKSTTLVRHVSWPISRAPRPAPRIGASVQIRPIRGTTKRRHQLGRKYLRYYDKDQAGLQILVFFRLPPITESFSTGPVPHISPRNFTFRLPHTSHIQQQTLPPWLLTPSCTTPR